jgi:hypothetical protein
MPGTCASCFLIGRLPESWIAPAHLLDLRARVRCRHTLVEQFSSASNMPGSAPKIPTNHART